MSLKPWREIAKPHKDVLEGTFKQSEFAADISLVASGNAPAEYQDAEKFFSRTFITEGMRLLLTSVVQRLSGHGGDPVIQLQTAFGGGKTHTMLTVFHLATRKVDTWQLMGIPPILDAAGINDLPYARVAVLDGIKLSPSQALPHDGIQVNTLWGELAWQLAGKAGYELVKLADQDGTSPGKEVLINLLQQAAPCVILIDELVAFIRQFEPGQHYLAGTFDSNISFIQALTEALKAVPNALLLASLPESDLEVGGTNGQRTLNSLEKYFARVESVWKPVATEEAFEIVRRRLFDSVGDTAELDAVCQQFAELYRQGGNKFPTETQNHHYEERLRRSYPIHPEIFDRLYEDWSTLDKFQRTRGVLQYMAIVIHRLWNSDNRDALIMPGSIPLDDSNVRNKSIHYLPQGWEPIIEKEIDGTRSEPFDIDGKDTRFGSVQAARRAARTIFLGSAPSTSDQMIRGVSADHVLLGSVQPGQTISVFEDVLKRLRDRLHYLYAEENRFWFDTKPNLRREMESRKQQLNDKDHVQPLLKDFVRRAFGSNHGFAGIHVFVPSADVSDDYGVGPRLVVLPITQACYSKDSNNQAFAAAEQILRFRGDQPRQKQNRLIFLAADFDVANRLRDQAKTYLAWQSIVSDISNEKLNLDLFQVKQAKKHKEGAEQSLQQMIRETYKWLICPTEDFVSGKPQLNWEVVTVSTTAPNLIQEIESRLREEEWLIFEWSPIHLMNLLKRWYFKEGTTEISALKVWQDCCHYLYLPRLVKDDVFKNAINLGLHSQDFFGFASGKSGDKYLGFIFDDSASIILDESSLLIERDTAAAYKETLKPVEHVPPNKPGEGGIGNGVDKTPPTVRPPVDSTPPISTPAKKHFYGTINLDPVRAKIDFATIVDEVVEQFTSKLGVDVKISIEIQATSQKDGFDDAMQRAVKENCRVLKFGNAEFEGD
jgi:predicted AAA+ superfamily ATPase